MPTADFSASDLCICTLTAQQWSMAAHSMADRLHNPCRLHLLDAAETAMQSTTPETAHWLQAQLHSRTTGLGWGERLPGRLGQIRHVFLAPRETDETAHQLIHQLDQQFATKSVVFALTALREPETMAARWFEACGYEFLCRVDTVCQKLSSQTKPSPSAPLEFVPGAESRREELVAIIEATYQQSYDCPKLQNLRSIDDTLDGYAQRGLVAPNGWSFVQYKGKSIGCLLMTAFESESFWELSYLGLTPTARGQGWGRQIVEYGCFLAAQAGAGLVIASVDQKNEPAKKIYHQLGFDVVDQSKIYGKQIKNSASQQVQLR